MDYFSGIVGQDRALAPLKKALETGNLSHAYLFVGPDWVGKQSIAELFARAIILDRDEQAAIYLKENAHPDFLIIEKLENKTLIGIEQITARMEPWLALKPYRAVRRVVIVKEAHLLSLAAANALLKTLEEPPGHAVIILVSDENNLLDTIISRCQLIRFSPIADIYVAELLQGRGIESSRAEHLARLGQGSISRALLFAEEEGLENYWQIAHSLIKDLSSGQQIEVYKAAEKIEEKPQIISNLIQATLRDIYIYQITRQDNLLLIEDNREICRSFKEINPERVNRALTNIDELKKSYRSSISSLLLSINISYELQDALK